MPIRGFAGYGGAAASLINNAGGPTEATGGTIYYYNSKTIHRFTGPGTFETPASFEKSCEYVTPVLAFCVNQEVTYPVT